MKRAKSRVCQLINTLISVCLMFKRQSMMRQLSLPNMVRKLTITHLKKASYFFLFCRQWFPYRFRHSDPEDISAFISRLGSYLPLSLQGDCFASIACSSKCCFCPFCRIQSKVSDSRRKRAWGKIPIFNFVKSIFNYDHILVIWNNLACPPKSPAFLPTNNVSNVFFRYFPFPEHFLLS